MADVEDPTPPGGPVAEKAPEKAETPVPVKTRSEIPEQVRGLVSAAHPRQALLTGAALGVGAALADRPAAAAALVGVGGVVVQVVLGLVDDARDAERDRRTGRSGKAVADGRLPADNARFVALCLAILAVPLALQNGWAAATALGGYLVIGLLSQTRLRDTLLSFLPWVVGFALLPATLSYGGDGIGLHGGPPSWAITGCAALVGLGVHLVTSVRHLVPDNKAGSKHLPLRLARRVGASTVLVLGSLLTLGGIAGVVAGAAAYGLRQ